MSTVPAVRLDQYKGMELRRGELVEVTRPQQRVFLGKHLVGYVADKPGSKFCPITAEIAADEREAILKAIAAFHGTQSAAGVVIPDFDPQQPAASEPATQTIVLEEDDELDLPGTADASEE